MANIDSKKHLIPVRFLPGKNVSGLFDKVNIPEIDITYLKSFQHRTKAWRVEGYNPSKPPVKKRKEYRLNINGFKAWKIGFKNKHHSAVDITLHFRIQGKYVPGYNYKQTCSNLLPDKEAEMVVISGLKTGWVRLDRVEVYSDSNTLSRTEVNAFMPYWKGSSLFSFISSWVLGICFLLWNIYMEPDSTHKHTITWLTYISLSLAILDVYNITPVIIMFLLLVAGPFILHDPVQLTVLMVLGCLYIWATWRKRSSIKDFLIGAFIP